MPSKLSIHEKTRRSYLVILAVLSVGLYMNTCLNGFVLDDNAAIVGNKIVTRGVTAIPEIFSTPYHQGFNSYSHGLYRPLASSLFAIEYQIGGGNAFPLHLINVLLFAADVLLLFFLLQALFGPSKMTQSFVAALLFALLPIHTEVVANIKSQDELLCFFFSFLSLLVLMKYAASGKITMLVAGLVFLSLALLSKETAVVFLGINAVLFFGFFPHKRNRSVAILIGTMLMISFFIFLRFHVLNAYGAGEIGNVSIGQNSLAGIPSFWSREATAIFMAGKYLWLMLFPVGLVCDYSFNSIPPTSFSDLSVLLSLLVYLIILGIGIYRLFHFRKDWLAFAALFFLISFALFANVFFLVGATMAERFMFFPSVGWCMAAALLVCRVPSIRQSEGAVFKNATFLAIFFPLTIIYGSLTILRNTDWKDANTLFAHDVQLQPNNYRLHQYLGFSLISSSFTEDDSITRTQTYKEAIQQFKISIAIFPETDATPYRAIGVSYINLRQFDSAGKYLEQSLARESKDTLVRNNLAGVFFARGDYQKSIEMCRINIDSFPDYQQGYVNMGASYLKLGKYDSAKMVLSKAVSLAPDDKKAQYFLSVAREYSGK
ncbi:MAG: tetratricopeptide repeat protein [Chitinophagaceae bacterium]